MRRHRASMHANAFNVKELSHTIWPGHLMAPHIIRFSIERNYWRPMESQNSGPGCRVETMDDDDSGFGHFSLLSHVCHRGGARNEYWIHTRWASDGWFRPKMVTEQQIDRLIERNLVETEKFTYRRHFAALAAGEVGTRNDFIDTRIHANTASADASQVMTFWNVFSDDTMQVRNTQQTEWIENMSHRGVRITDTSRSECFSGEFVC